MIADYKLHHGAVLADIIDRSAIPVTIEESTEEGRLLNYVLNGCVGMQIKFAKKRLRPWQFAFPPTHITDLHEMSMRLRSTFLVLVCGSDGIAAIDAADVLPSLHAAESGQAWLRAERRKREHYRVHGSLGELPQRYTTNTLPIIEALIRT
jgi:hypothetical protein